MNLVIVALWRSLFGTSTVRAAVPPTEQPKAIRTVLRPSIPLAIESEAGRSVEWVPRPADYWQQRTEWVLQRLGNEWRATADDDAWPDVRELLELLARTPDAVIRQLPAAARDALALCDNASLSRVQLAERLSVDPSLIQAVLRQANGAWFGAGLQPVLRVDAAIDRIGMAGTRAVVLSRVLTDCWPNPAGSMIRWWVTSGHIWCSRRPWLARSPRPSAPTARKRFPLPCCTTSASWCSSIRSPH
ncbi:MAG: HDOD domain-containing protein [Gemmatimonadaceae bacterium]|nr:HDOD domain-containing protein [Gemmatimonadaceae bacterium]